MVALVSSPDGFGIVASTFVDGVVPPEEVVSVEPVPPEEVPETASLGVPVAEGSGVVGLPVHWE